MRFLAFAYCLVQLISPQSFAVELTPRLVASEVVAECSPANNGAGPFWCYGSPLLFRDEGHVFASISETGKDVPPLCNTRWRLFRRDASAWSLVQSATEFRLREPSPIGGFPGGPVFLSITPSIEPVGTHYGRTVPKLLNFDRTQPVLPPRVEIPPWIGEPHFTDHSYRGFAVDGPNQEILWMNIDATTSLQHWSYRNAKGEWPNQGSIEFPIRAAYPQVALRNRAAYVMAIGDIVEPIKEWREFKFEQSGQSWDYVFRRLFFAWTPDIAQSGFNKPIEIDTLESTSGHITNLDLWIDPQGAAHLLYVKSNVQSDQMRGKYFPGLPILRSLEYVVVDQGEITKREMLMVGGEIDSEATANYARFHSTPDGRLWVVATVARKSVGVQLEMMPVYPELSRAPGVVLQSPTNWGMLFTATENGGSPPSWTLDLLGPGGGNTIQYSQFELISAP